MNPIPVSTCRGTCKHKMYVWMCVEGLEVRELFKAVPNNFQNVLLYVLFIKDFCLTLMKCWHPQI